MNNHEDKIFEEAPRVRLTIQELFIKESNIERAAIIKYLRKTADSFDETDKASGRIFFKDVVYALREAAKNIEREEHLK